MNKKNKNNLSTYAEINNLRKSLLNLRFQKATGQLEKTSEIRKTKKKIANFLTGLKSKENKSA